MSRLRLSMNLISILSVAAALASCGSPYQFGGATTGTAAGTTSMVNGVQFVGGNLTYSVTMAGTLNSTSPNPAPTPCSTSKTVAATTTNGAWFSDSFSADNFLQVQVTAGQASNNQIPSGTSAAVANYNCMAVNVTLQMCLPNPNNTSQWIWSDNGAGNDTYALSANGTCYSGSSSTPQPSAVAFDFYKRLSPNLNNTPAYRIKVSNPRNDYRYMQCLQNPALWTGYGMTSCSTYYPMSAMYQYNTITATVAIANQNNGSN